MKLYPINLIEDPKMAVGIVLKSVLSEKAPHAPLLVSKKVDVDAFEHATL